jgi:nucleoside-diphosphate-sugar epimerase
MVHRDDAAGAVRFALEDGVDDVLLVVDDEPVSKWEFADWLAGECGVDAPPKRTKAERLAADGLSDAARRRILTSKRCSNRRLHEHGYEFSYPTFREGYRDAIDAYRADG